MRARVLRELVLRARVRAAFFAACLRCVALRLRVAAAFFAAARRLAGPPLARSSRSSTSERSSVTALRAPLPGGLLSALPNALARLLAALLRRPRARRVSKRSTILGHTGFFSLRFENSFGAVDSPPQVGAEAIAESWVCRHACPASVSTPRTSRSRPAACSPPCRPPRPPASTRPCARTTSRPGASARASRASRGRGSGAALEATSLSLGCVNAPGQRYHPAIIAQASATLAEMYPGRFWVALGSGEASNEHITGDAVAGQGDAQRAPARVRRRHPRAAPAARPSTTTGSSPSTARGCGRCPPSRRS